MIGDRVACYKTEPGARQRPGLGSGHGGRVDNPELKEGGAAVPSEDNRSAPTGATLLIDRLRREGEPVDRCACGKPPKCVGQFEGEMQAKVACDDCCAHVDYGACGRCYPLASEEPDHG